MYGGFLRYNFAPWDKILQLLLRKLALLTNIGKKLTRKMGRNERSKVMKSMIRRRKI